MGSFGGKGLLGDESMIWGSGGMGLLSLLVWVEDLLSMGNGGLIKSFLCM